MHEEIIRACTALSVAYARFVDFQDYESFVALFTEDAELDLGFVLHGRAAIRKSMAKRPGELRSRHVLSNIHIDVLDADHAQGISYLTLYRHIGPESLLSPPIDQVTPAAVGHYSDRFRRMEAGWRIAARSLSLAFRDPSQF